MMRREFLGTVSTAALAFSAASVIRAQSDPRPLIRWADLDVASAQLDGFEAAGRAHGEAVLRTEPGVFAFHAVSEIGNPARVRVFEMYEDAQAYQSHLKQPHFQQFIESTKAMMTGRQLYDMVPVRLGAKSRLTPSPHVRVAELDIAPAQLQSYIAAVTEEIDDSIRLEPGVLTIYSVAMKDRPNHLRFFEIYADEAAYKQHIDSPHFKKYVRTTQSMITSRQLFETRPVFLGLKQR
jgi:quinol monooxygenase YgiN